jgi:cysteinyl-tRNA synthetase
MKLQLFSSQEKKIVSLELNPGKVVNIYLCGPTVYDHIHLGNLRPVIVFDVLHRLLLSLGLKVNYIQNITDIDDKIIAKAQQEKKSEKKISNHYTKSYLANLIRYNVVFPAFLPRVTDYIPQIQNFINSLERTGLTYQKGEEVFFRVGENQEYGKLSGQNLAKLKEGTREIAQVDKENNRDFVLWKKTIRGMAWNSPWGMGRPGWHTECAVFIDGIFNSQTIDIHGGGNDLLFPHHENERIQYLAKNKQELSKIWLHVAHLHWKEEKMSKSLGNVVLAKHFAKIHGANTFRYLILNSHYNQVINFSEELIQQAKDYVQKIKNLGKKLYFHLYLEKLQVRSITTFQRKEVVESLLNNLNTIKVFYFLEKVITFLNKSIDQKKINNQEFQEAISDFFFILNILGFKFEFPNYDLRTKLLINRWQRLRKEKKYSQADEVRGELQKNGVI